MCHQYYYTSSVLKLFKTVKTMPNFLAVEKQMVHGIWLLDTIC